VYEEYPPTVFTLTFPGETYLFYSALTSLTGETTIFALSYEVLAFVDCCCC